MRGSQFSKYCVVFMAALPQWVNASPGIEFSQLVPNYFGLAGGVTPEWAGAKDDMAGVVPGARVKLDNNRYAEWYGPYAGIKVNQDMNFEWGPAMVVRLGRQEVENEAVAALPEIGYGLDLGGFVGYAVTRTDTAIPFYSRVGLQLTTAVAGDAKGTNATVYANTWVPLSRQVFVGLGLGATWADDKYMQHYFGVDAAGAAQSGISEFDAQAGVRQFYAWPAIMYQVNPQWYLAAGAYYQKLTNDAANSSIVKEQGDDNQLTYGLGLGYAW